jgi:salicylate biosynthesis isochorismate synthase/menaquinone-specific isochorismate synthase
MTRDFVASPGQALDSLERLLEEAGGKRALVSVTVPVEIEDPTAAVFASRLATDRWFCWEQPDRDGFAIAALGSAHEVVSRGPDRFRDAVAACGRVTHGRRAEEAPGLPAGAGPVWVGGFSFADDGGVEPQWSSFPPALLVMPELALHRAAGATHLTLCALAGPGADHEATSARLRARLGALRDAPLPIADPHPTGEARIASALPPERFEASVARGVERIRANRLDKVVLAREVVVDAPRAHDAGPLYGALREAFPSCFCVCCGSPEAAFLAASPELLVRRSGAGATTVALAGSTRRSADPSVDDHLGEQLRRSAKDRREHEIVVRRIERLLRPHSVWVEATPEPGLVKVANIQHLATPIHAQLSDSRSAVELAGILHPTPAVGGEPRAAALAAIEELEGLDRGWYAGPVGWMDAAEDGEFCVALRSALLRDRSAHLYAGGGIVAASDPAAELAETELKLEAILPLVAG